MQTVAIARLVMPFIQSFIYLLKTQHIWQVVKAVDELDQQGSEEHLLTVVVKKST